jgi:UDP-glucose 4-epimerase
MAILVTGGAGYIGSVMVDLLLEQGDSIIVLDDLSRGHREALDDRVAFYHGETGNRSLVEDRFAANIKLQACIHFAALAYVGESVAESETVFRKECRAWNCIAGCFNFSGRAQIRFLFHLPQSTANPFAFAD